MAREQKPVFDGFISFIEEFAIPVQNEHPEWITLDGKKAGDPEPKKRAGVIAYLTHGGNRYQVDTNARLDNLIASYRAWEDGKVAYPVVVAPSRGGNRKLNPAPGAADQKGFFIYNLEPFSAEDITVEGDGLNTAVGADHLGQIDALTREQTNRLKRDAAFRRRALRIWAGKCALTGCEDETVLDAAHLDAHASTGDNRAINSIVLRCDLHRLMDSGLLSITRRGGSLIVSVCSSVAHAEYHGLDGKVIRLQHLR